MIVFVGVTNVGGLFHRAEEGGVGYDSRGLPAHYTTHLWGFDLRTPRLDRRVSRSVTVPCDGPPLLPSRESMIHVKAILHIVVFTPI